MNTRLHSVCASAARIRCLPHFASVAVLALAFVGAPAVQAQSNVTGAVYGTVAGATAGTTVTAVNKNTGLKREVAVDPTGGYQLASLPTGVYSLTMHVPGQEDQMVDDVQVKVGTGTAVRFAANAKAEEKAARDVVDLKSLPTAELQKRFLADSAKHDTRAFTAIGRLAQEALQAKDAALRDARVREIL